MDNSPKRSKASSADERQSSPDVADHSDTLLVPGKEQSAIHDRVMTEIDDPALKAVFARIRRDLSFIAQHHPGLKMSGEELSVWAKAIARQLNAESLVEDSNNEVVH
ncbi:MAG: hypothetical protein ACR2PM_14035 [Hyphomicrobiales bacterium]